MEFKSKGKKMDYKRLENTLRHILKIWNAREKKQAFLIS